MRHDDDFDWGASVKATSTRRVRIEHLGDDRWLHTIDERPTPDDPWVNTYLQVIGPEELRMICEGEA